MKYLVLAVLLSFPLFANDKIIKIGVGCSEVEYTKAEPSISPYRYTTYLGKIMPADTYRDKERTAIFGCYGLGGVLGLIDSNGNPTTFIRDIDVYTFDNKDERTLFCDFMSDRFVPNKLGLNRIVPIWKLKDAPIPRKYHASGKEYSRSEYSDDLRR